ncbi:ankyrin repeat protein [Flavobacterium nitrogenifigens]|uniref:Ankyrin repeat protein n=2 Tax=Flavobacterium TaxID=237 RepID=A0A7W7N870_9FLAO|nr:MULTISPECIES: ankyrin repeat domain-containing protein [Flavobacterium]MBB4802126.1 ankyrin repeat protein [Flavobacterium nitrogenifigens]MBB6387084.1 ankyrin repeat protein [Flavobacterium notoginsengisoli]
MKKIFFLAAAIASIAFANAQKSKIKILDREFWKASPDLTAVKAELNGYNFADAKNGDDPLSLAIGNDASIEVVKYLADQPGIDFQRNIREGRTYLHAAAAKPNAEAVDYLLQKGADMNFLCHHDQTALTFAGFSGTVNLAVIKAFEKHGLDLKKTYPAKNDANILLLAVGADANFEITDYLMSKGISIQSVDSKGNNAFDYAVKYGNVSVLKKLVEKGVKYSDQDLLFAAQGAFRKANKIDVFKYLVEDLKIKPDVTSASGENVLHYIAAKNNQDDIIAYFISKGVNINQENKEGNTPFMNAAGGKSFEIVGLMLPKVKNINAVNTKGESALTNAVKSGSPKSVDLLLSKGADAKIKDKQGNDLAYHLVESYRPARGGFGGGNAEENKKQDDFGDKIKSLQKSGLNFNAPQKDGGTLYHVAIAKNDVELFKKLSPLKIDVNAKNKEGLTVLHRAAMVSRNDEILKYLISIGAKKEITSEFNETAYTLAKENDLLTKNNIGIDFLK